MEKRKLTEVQVYMISQIEAAIKEAKERISKLEKINNRTIRETTDLFNLKSKLKQLEKQLVAAKKPINRTKEEINTINSLVDNIKIEVDGVERSNKMKEEKQTKIKIPTGKDLFERQLNEYISNVKEALTSIEKGIETQKFVIDAVESKLKSSTGELKGIEDLLNQNKKSLEELILKQKQYQVILRMAKNKFIDKLLEDYEKLKLIDLFLGGVFNFQDKDKTLSTLIKRYKI